MMFRALGYRFGPKPCGFITAAFWLKVSHPGCPTITGPSQNLHSHPLDAPLQEKCSSMAQQSGKEIEPHTTVSLTFHGFGC